MATGFIDKITRMCGGNRTLAWLLTANVGAALLLWCAALVLKLCGVQNSLLYAATSLPGDALGFATHPWTIATYMLVHFSPLHLIFNMLWLFWFGKMLSDVERDNVVLWLFIGGGLAGGVLYVTASVLAGHGPGSYLTGSSSAVLAIMCATALRLPDRTLNFFLLGEIKLKWVALACVLLTVAGSWGAFPVQAAHIGGIVFGSAWFLGRRRLHRVVSPASRGSSSHGRQRKINVQATRRAMRREVPDEVRLDQLLDKIRVSGYDSLSSKEKTELNHISKRLDKADKP